MSRAAEVKSTASFIALMQDIEALRIGCPHYGMQVLSAQEIAEEFGAQTDGRNCFYRIYDNQNDSREVIRVRMNDSLTINQRPAGYNAEFVIRSIDSPQQFQVGLVRGADGLLKPVMDLYNTGRGLAHKVMSKRLFAETSGHLHGDAYPDEAYQQLVRMSVNGRSIIDLEKLGLNMERLPGEGEPLFTVRFGDKQIDLSTTENGTLLMEGRRFPGDDCLTPINRILSALNRTMENVRPSAEMITEPVKVEQFA